MGGKSTKHSEVVASGRWFSHLFGALGQSLAMTRELVEAVMKE